MGEKYQNINYEPEVLDVMNKYKPLVDWFKRNEFPITYFSFCKPHIDSYLSRDAHFDNLTLEKMSSVALFWIKSSEYTPYERAVYAALAINKIYNEAKEQLSEINKEAFKIIIPQDVKLPEEVDLLNPPAVIDYEIAKYEEERDTYLAKAKMLN